MSRSTRELTMLTTMIAAFSDPKVRTATAYMSPTYTMRLSLVLPPDRWAHRRYFSLTLGKPNFEGRKFIAAAQAAGEPFPVKKVQLRFWPKDWAKKKKARVLAARRARKRK